MEYEIRFYYRKSEYDKIIDCLEKIPALHSNLKLYEYTIQYNHSDKKYDFYNEAIDGRFRLRISRTELNNKCKLSWKQRTKDMQNSQVNAEIEKEVRINPDDIGNFIYIIENIMHFEVVESYERYRTIYENNDIKIAVDEYPFGLCVEIENKSIDKNPEEVIAYWTKRIGLDVDKAYRLSWDDKYEELCREQGVECFKEVKFDKPMPQVKNEFIIDDNHIAI